VNHDYDVGAGGKGQPVASLLIAPVTTIFRVHFHLNPVEGARDCHRLIPAAIVHQNDEIDQVLSHNLVVSTAQGLSRIISRHYHDDLLTVNHDRFAGSTRSAGMI